jgi:hypothetical protein
VAHQASSSLRHGQQWVSSVESYCHPVIGHLPVEAIDINLVMQIIEPLWADKPETASRVRARIESVLDYAKTRGRRSGDNPARWRGHLDQALPKISKLAPVVHYPALPYRAIAAFMADLRALDDQGAPALKLAILCVSTGRRRCSRRGGPSSIWRMKSCGRSRKSG